MTTVEEPLAANRERQRELYGTALGDRVRALTAALGISQARLAGVLGISPAMLSQLVSARRVKIGDPAVLARLTLLDERARALSAPPPSVVEVLLGEVARTSWRWSGADRAAEALRGIVEPDRLAAAAVALGPGFPELVEVLRRAAR
jgi:transcriptional regulator with XRE-family HTH domain